MSEIVVTGFPKCGTTALMKSFEQDPDVNLIKNSVGKFEINWPMIKSLRPELPKGRILAHKFTAYAYNQEALEYLTELNPKSILVLCVRDPAKSLISWHKMHRTIARSGRNPAHFAYKERDFYADCSILDYYDRFAKRRLRYDLHFEQMLLIVPKDRLFVVSQERMAKGIDQVADHIKALARGTSQPMADVVETETVHKGYADLAKNIMPIAIQNHLGRVRDQLAAAIAKSGVDSCL